MLIERRAYRDLNNIKLRKPLVGAVMLPIVVAQRHGSYGCCELPFAIFGNKFVKFAAIAFRFGVDAALLGCLEMILLLVVAVFELFEHVTAEGKKTINAKNSEALCSDSKALGTLTSRTPISLH